MSGTTRRAALGWLAGGGLVLAAGCAQPPRLREGPAHALDHWTGRLGLQVEGDEHTAQSLSAGFELSGSAAAGALALYNPLGNQIARLQWSAAGAWLATADGERHSDSLQALARELTGTELPIGALFDWLAGAPAEAPGWQADLSRLGEGRLVATRHTPPPQAVLRIVLDR
ncbi:outer membrane lipoprotein LolB [Melaminivora alkalimesophila]|uniref:Outer-membrane lipoprotein LolB n=2 Tax=Melaminivora alkalimesophila TaxID=1165852 RepID=A0A317RFI6_9BURK|nr:lipoprotein insertase outer membrane protein LolB [Melaminivora alkalimesophila]PWW48659.1 outer membrane lipoprotein LolB [Melaminivora alkalimesophila]